MPDSNEPDVPRLSARGDLASWLRRAAERGGPQPWLFEPRGIDWRWRSWRQVVDQIARASENLRRNGTADPSWPSSRLDADSVAGGLAWMVTGRDWACRSGGPGTDARPTWLPEVRDRLSAWEPTLPQSSETRGGIRCCAGNEAEDRISWEEVEERALRLVESLPSGRRGDPPILLAAGRLDGLAERILVLGSALAGTALALEPDPALLAVSTERLRPHVVLGPRTALEELARRRRSRRRRRGDRLKAVLIPEGCGEIAPGLPLLEGAWGLGEVGDAWD